MTTLAAPQRSRTLSGGSWRTPATLGGALLGLTLLVAALPWLRGEDPARTVLRTRSTEREADPAALAAVRAELDLPANPVVGALGWIGGALRGDLGVSWISGAPVGPGVFRALTVSATLAGVATLVAVGVGALVLVPGLWRATRTGSSLGRGTSVVAAVLGSVPEIVLALVLIAVVAVQWRLLPTSGFASPAHLVLPALALGLPAGGLLGRVLTSGVDATLAESWVRSWRSVGAGRTVVAAAVTRRAFAVAMPQVALLLVGLLGSAVAVERAFAIPGLGSTALQAVLAQDIPVLQACVTVLVLLGLSVGAAGVLAHRAVLGPALRSAELPAAVPDDGPSSTLARSAPGLAAGVLVLLVMAGLVRDSSTVTLGDRLAAPSGRLPFGADALGRDTLARFGHGAVLTVGTAVAVTAVCLVVGLAVGLASRSGRPGIADVLNALPPVLVGILIAAMFGPGLLGAAAAIAAVGWIPLAVHARTLAGEARSSGYVRAAVLAGAGPRRIARRHVLPTVLPPVLRHALVRVPHAALGIAALSFLGLGASPDSPEWGAMLADSLAYLGRAPWTIAAPALGLALLGLIVGLMRGSGERSS